jgi:hypothetical protein
MAPKTESVQISVSRANLPASKLALQAGSQAAEVFSCWLSSRYILAIIHQTHFNEQSPKTFSYFYPILVG